MAMPTIGSMPRAAYATTQTLDKQKSQPSYLESANKSYKIAKDYEIPFFFLSFSIKLMYFRFLYKWKWRMVFAWKKNIDPHPRRNSYWKCSVI